MWFVHTIRKTSVLSYSINKKVHLNGLDFCQNPENLDFGPFESLNLRVFQTCQDFINWVSPFLILYDYLTSYKKSDNGNDLNERTK